MVQILLVEDEPELRRLIVQMLRSRQYEVFEAAQGDEALKRVGELNLRIDLLITDISMPVMGGLELAAKMRALNPDVRTLFLSGDVGPHLQQGASDIGPVSFLEKPFSSAMLLEKIREILSAPV